MTERDLQPGLLQHARVYLSGPMDFVGDPGAERRYGWRHRLTRVLQRLGVTVFDPWVKPDVVGLHEYGKESSGRLQALREQWTFSRQRAGVQARARVAEKFWRTLHIDLRMVDTADFVIAYCPTNVYSVGTVHEIILASQQHKPVLFVSPRVAISSLEDLRTHLRGDVEGLRLLAALEREAPIRPNPVAVPSLWYVALLGGHRFFDGFGFIPFGKLFRWPHSPLDAEEGRARPRRPLLPYILRVNRRIPRRYESTRDRYVPDEDWLLWKLGRPSA